MTCRRLRTSCSPRVRSLLFHISSYRSCIKYLCKVGVDPGNIVSDSGVNTREASFSTTLTPRDETDQDTGAGVDDWATAISRAGVLSTRGQTGAEHVGGDGRGAVTGLARCSGNHRYGNVSQGGWNAAGVRAGGSPRVSRISNDDFLGIVLSHRFHDLYVPSSSSGSCTGYWVTSLSWKCSIGNSAAGSNGS